MKLQDFINKYGDVQIDENELKELLGIKSEKYFIPKEEDAYWFVTDTGTVTSETNYNWDTDIKICENNEVFSTKEEAEEHAKKQRFLLQMKRDFLDNSGDIDWNHRRQQKHCLLYSHVHGTVFIDDPGYMQGNDFVTTNRKWLEEYIEKYEEEIKRYYFEIKEEK